MDEHLTPEQFDAIQKHINSLMLESVDREEYEKAAVCRDAMAEISNWELGYGSEVAYDITFAICKENGKPVDAYRSSPGEYIVVYQFKDIFFEFMLYDFVDYIAIKKHI